MLRLWQRFSFLFTLNVLMLPTYSPAAQIVSVFPTGSTKQIQQARVRFDKDIVAMGDPRSKIEPFNIECNSKSNPTAKITSSIAQQTSSPRFKTRWADSRNWVLDFDRPLQAGVRCSLKLNGKIKDQSGEKIMGLDEYSFSTAGPSIVTIVPRYSQIEPDQYFVILTDGAIDQKSLEAHSYFEVQNIPEKVGVRVIEGKPREEVLRAAFNSEWEWSKYSELLRQNPKRAFSQISEFENFVVLAGQRRFPESSVVVLHWTKGILSKTGLPVEEPQSFNYAVVEPFLAELSCERSKAQSPCNPVTRIQLKFNRKVLLKSLRGTKLVGPNGQTWLPEELGMLEQKKGGEISNNSSALNRPSKEIFNPDEAQTESLTFKPPFPAQKQLKLIIPSNLRDELFRPLSNQNKFPLEFSTDAYLPLIKFAALFGIIESKGDPALPVSVRNIEKQMQIRKIEFQGRAFSLSGAQKPSEIISWYRKVTRKDYDDSKRNEPLLEASARESIQMPKPLGEREFEVVGIPLKKPGFYVVEMQSPRLGLALTDMSPMYVASAALVTDMAVHFKKGRESSLVWVTQLSDSKPVEGAQITLVDGLGRELAQGKTDQQGILRLKEINYPCVLNSTDTGNEEDSYDSCEIFVFAKKDDDLSFVSSNWEKGIESYRFNLRTEYLDKSWGPVIFHTVLDRMAAQPGEVVQMKHILRESREMGFAMMNKSRLPKRVLVTHRGSSKTFTLPFEYDPKTGSAIGKFQIPKDAPLGRYSISLSNKNEKAHASGEDEGSYDWSSKETGYFVVSQYRLPLMKATVKILGEALVRPSEILADLSGQYLSGGPAKGLKVKLRTSLRPGYFVPNLAGDNDYTFLSEPVKTGVFDYEGREQAEDSFLKVQNLVLSADGGLATKVSGWPTFNKLKQLQLEMEYVDPNGEIKTASAQAPIFPADSLVGLRTESWYSEQNKTKLMGVITGIDGKPKRDRTFVVEGFQTQYITHRKRLVGGFYSYDAKAEVKSLGKVCEGKSDELGRFKCEPKNLPAGDITFQAKTLDDKNRASFASVNTSIYARGADPWWIPSDSDRIDIIPEKNRYEPNETAKLVVRSPFATSKVLVTVEREGVLESFVTEITRERSTVEIPLKGHYAPNVFVSVLALRGRINDVKPTALLDLGRPSMKMGLVELKVGYKAHELLVDVKSDKRKYQARDKAQVTVRVKTANGSSLPAGAEVILAAVDESLLQLKDNTSWNILSEMMGQRELAVETSSGQNQVVGRRHFGAKAKAPGGSGGSSAGETRELFEPVIYWQPRVKLSAQGEAKVTIPLNDSMTSFRFVAVATAGENAFGEGHTTVESSKDLILYSGFAPLVREGDQVQNAFTIRNTTNKPMKVSLSINAPEIQGIPPLPVVVLQANEAKTLSLPITVPSTVTVLNFRITAKDSLSGAGDSLVSKVRVESATPSRVLQSTLFQLDRSFQIPVRKPADALAGKGGLGVKMSPSLVSSLAGVRSYMQDYPYSCLEQQISRSIVLEDKLNLQKIIGDLPSYFDQNGLLKFFTTSMCGSVQLTRHVLDILYENNSEIPEATRTRLIDGLKQFTLGTHQCRSWWDERLPNRYSDEEKTLIFNTLSKYKSFTPNLLTTIKITPNLWKTQTVVAWYQLLKRQNEIPGRGEKLKQAENILQSRVNFQGTTMNVQGDLDWESEWRLFTSRDQEALGVFGVSIEEPSWSQDVGRMARGLIARLKKGHWDSTMANAWGVLYLRRFSQKYEKDKVTGETKISANDISSSVNWKTHEKGNNLFLNWPKDSEKKVVPVQFDHSGSGKPWVSFETHSAIPLKAPLDFGYKISRKVTLVQSPDSSGSARKGSAVDWKVGDVANVELTITAKSDQPWVVLRDAIPAGSSHLGTGLDGSSVMLDRAPLTNARAGEVQEWPIEYDEKSQSHYTAYAAYLPKGTYRVNYRVRLNSAGDFKLPPSRVEAMYAPETFGETPHANWKVAQ